MESTHSATESRPAPGLLAATSDDADAPLRVALVGSPNSGKTTLFNALTGLRRKVANYPGVTVDHQEGEVDTEGSRRLTLIDLPGTYTLEPLSADEAVSVDVLAGRQEGCPPVDAILVVVDSTTLRRSLPILTEALSFGLPTALVLTMVDELKTRKGKVDVDAFEAMLGLHVFPIIGNRGIGLDALREALANPTAWPAPKPSALPDSVLTPIALVDGEATLQATTTEATLSRFEWVDSVCEAVFTPPQEADSTTDKIDRFVLHPVLGLGLFAVTMFTFFQLIFVVAAPLQEAAEGLVGSLGTGIAGAMEEGMLRNLIVDGVIGGVGSVVVFLPQIAILLLLIRFLEGVGYMARAAFLIDRVMGRVGLEGRAFIALLSSYACAVPGIMATRTIPDPKSRLATILVAPFMTCSARLPVYTLLIAAFVPATSYGPFGLQGLTLFGLYLLGAVSALVAAAIFKRGMLKGTSLPFYMELPPYRMPTLRVLLGQTWGGVRLFLKKAGTLIFVASVILWALLTFPQQAADPDMDEADARAAQIEQSYAAAVGKTLEPAIEPLGFDWSIGVGLVASLAAREVIVATLGQIYAHTGDEEDLDGLGARLKSRRGPDGKPIFSLATVLSLLVFFVYALQCVSTLAVIRRETNSYRWPVFAFSYMLGVAYIASLITYQVSLAVIG